METVTMPTTTERSAWLEARRANLGRAINHLLEAAEIVAEEEPRKAPQVLDLVVCLLRESSEDAKADAVASRVKTMRSTIRSAVRRGEI